MHETPPPIRYLGFTLVELLVVLTIIAALSALAVPAIRSAMERADRTVCLSNLRQLGQAFQEYRADHGHYPAAELPVLDGTGREVERKRWYHALGPYLGTGPKSWSSGQGAVTVDPTTGEASGFVLPSEDDRDQDAFSAVLRCPSVSYWETGRNGAYGYNHQVFGDARVIGQDANGDPVHRRYPVRRSAIADLTRTVLLIDSGGTGNGPYRPASEPRSSALGNHSFTVDPPVLPAIGSESAGIPPARWGSDSPVPGAGVPTLPSRPHGRHQGGCCVLYADGRAEWLPLDALLQGVQLWQAR